MTSLYTFLHRREMRRGDRLASLIRLSLLIPLIIRLLTDSRSSAGWLVIGTLAVYAGSLFWVQRVRYLPLLSGLSVILDSLLLTGFLFAGELVRPGVLGQSPLLFLYPLIIYLAYLRCDDVMLILSAVLNIILYNTAFLLSLGFSPELTGDLLLAELGPQLFRTLVLMIFSLALMDQSRRLRIILKNQNDYYEKVRKRNKPLFEDLDNIASRYGLSRRESEVLRELIKGKTYRSIGEDLFVSLDTIKSHVKSIYRKTGLKSRSELFGKLRMESEKKGGS